MMGFRLHTVSPESSLGNLVKDIYRAQIKFPLIDTEIGLEVANSFLLY